MKHKDVKALREASNPAEILHVYPDPHPDLGITLSPVPDRVDTNLGF